MAHKRFPIQVAVVFLMLSGLAEASEWPPAAQYKNSVDAARETLSQYRTLAEMAFLVGDEPERCIDVSNETRICSWPLGRAGTAFELSTLVGAAPERCLLSESVFFCIWKTHSGTYGHGTLAVGIDASFRKKVRLRCIRPADGSPRKPDSCEAEIGG